MEAGRGVEGVASVDSIAFPLSAAAWHGGCSVLNGGEGRGVRSFLAVLLPEAVRAGLYEATADLRRRAPRVAWVRAENLHVTLRFLGALDEGALARVGAALATATAETAPFRLTLHGLGGFPTAQAARVVWAGVTAGAEALDGLHARLEAALAREGFPPEGRSFHPHVTLGRAREPRSAPALGGDLTARRAPFGEVLVDAAHLMRSDLGPGGARYSVLAAGPLVGAKALDAC